MMLQGPVHQHRGVLATAAALAINLLRLPTYARARCTRTALPTTGPRSRPAPPGSTTATATPPTCSAPSAATARRRPPTTPGPLPKYVAHPPLPWAEGAAAPRSHHPQAVTRRGLSNLPADERTPRFGRMPGASGGRRGRPPLGVVALYREAADYGPVISISSSCLRTLRGKITFSTCRRIQAGTGFSSASVELALVDRAMTWLERARRSAS